MSDSETGTRLCFDCDSLLCHPGLEDSKQTGNKSVTRKEEQNEDEGC